MTTTLSSYPIVGILGRKQSGKSTLARYLVEDHGYTEHAYADPLRELALALDPIVLVTPSGQSYGLCHVVESIGWDTAKEQIPEVRRVLQRLGTDVFRAIDEDVWVDRMRALLVRRESPVVIPDVRFPNEAALVRELGGVLVRVVRPGAPTSDANASHTSETSVDEIPVDGVYRNTGPLDDVRSFASDLVYYLSRTQ